MSNVEIEDLFLSSSEAFISGLLSTIILEESEMEDIFSSEGSYFLSATADTYVNITSCEFENVHATNNFISSRGLFSFITGEAVNGTFVDAEASEIIMNHVSL